MKEDQPRKRLSLRWKILLPLVISSVLVAVAIVWHLQGRAHRQLVSDLERRAEFVAYMISYAGESINRSGEFQRIVSAVGADRDIRQIVVVVGSPPRVIGATHAWLRAEPLERSQGERLYSEMKRVIENHEKYSTFNDEAETFVLIAPIQLTHDAYTDGSPADGAVVIKVDTRSLTEEGRRSAVTLSLVFMVGLLALFVAAFVLLEKRVLHPVELINRKIESGEDDVLLLDRGIDANDELGRLAGALRDFRRRTDSAMRELANQKFALDQHAIVSIADSKGHITYANDKLCAISGYSQQELIGENHRILKSGHHPKEFYTQMWKTITSGNTWHGEICNRSKNGDIYWVYSSIIPLIGADGKPEAYIGIRTDITERKNIEEQLKTAKEAADAASQAKSDFLATMSHEIRTPLNGIIGFADLLLGTPLDSEQRHQVQLLHRSGETLLALINDILDLSKIESGKLVLENQRMDLHACVRDVIELLHEQASQKGLKLIVQITPDVPVLVMGDALRLRQIILNLVGNAVKFTSAGEIRVHVTAAEGFIRFNITDTGVGMNDEEQARLFRKFSQADTSTTRRFGGTGLGLVISKKLVEAMGGEIGVKSVKGEGSTFYFKIPIVLAVAGKDLANGVSLNADESVDSDDAFKCEGVVLVADDSSVNLTVAKAMLKSLGYEAHTAEDGRKVVELAGCQPYAAILMDYHMPVLDGVGATKEIRAGDGPNRDCPIIGVSASLEGRDECISSGMNSFLPKPFRKAELRQVLSEVISPK